MFDSVLIICVGNICRSPMGEGLFRQAARRQGKSLHAESAGISALVGQPADPIAQELLLEQGMDIRNHRARQLSVDMLRAADLVLVMERWQQEEVMKIDMGSRGRVYSIGHWINREIDDPYRQPRSAFEAALNDLQESIRSWCQKIC